MARILLIQNLHPTEANAIGISRMVAKILQKQGHEIFIRKFKPGETAYGIVYAVGKRELSPRKAYDSIMNVVGTNSPHYIKKVVQYVNETNAKYVFDFHCTGIRRRTMLYNYEFIIQPKIPIPARIIEIAALEKPLPKKVQETLESGIEKINAELRSKYTNDYIFEQKRSLFESVRHSYLTTQTEWLASKELLNPQTLAGNIAKEIHTFVEKSKILRPKVPLVKSLWRQTIRKIKFRK